MSPRTALVALALAAVVTLAAIAVSMPRTSTSTLEEETVFYTSANAVGWPRAYMTYLKTHPDEEVSADAFFAQEAAAQEEAGGVAMASTVRGQMMRPQLRYFSTQKLSPVYSPETKPTLQWNGLPEKQKNDLFLDSEHADDYYTKDNKDPFGPKGQYGMWMGIQGDTMNNWGCGPKGPTDCQVGTTPGEHWLRKPHTAPYKQGQKLKLEQTSGNARRQLTREAQVQAQLDVDASKDRAENKAHASGQDMNDFFSSINANSNDSTSRYVERKMPAIAGNKAGPMSDIITGMKATQQQQLNTQQQQLNYYSDTAHKANLLLPAYSEDAQKARHEWFKLHRTPFAGKQRRMQELNYYGDLAHGNPDLRPEEYLSSPSARSRGKTPVQPAGWYAKHDRSENGGFNMEYRDTA